jgi:hypothetical protein
MKPRKAILILFMVGCLMPLFSMQATAAWEWVTCNVDQVGPYLLTEGVNGSHIYLTDTAEPPAWEGSKKMFISPSRGKEYLAVALTALASGKRVKVYIVPSATFPTINGIYVVN